jgi:hypothetical protein
MNVELLNDGETIDILKLSKFNLLKPVKCEDCGHSTDFTRKIFRIMGVKKDDRCDDKIQGIISSFIKQEYGIINVFFKSPFDKFYADSACCPKCQSTRIIFDIEFTDEFLNKVSKLTGQPTKEILRDMNEIAQRIEHAQAKKN